MGDIQVTLLIGFFMLISYIWAKIPYGMTAVFCCLALEITGVLSSAEAWAGFSVCFDFHFRRRTYENKFYYKDTEASSENWQQ